MDVKTTLTNSLPELGEHKGDLPVALSNELVHLLSEQLYHSPLKAIEELVVNSFDADAPECRVFVPSPSDTDHPFIVVYDNGTGMDYQGLGNLWQIGRSNKRDAEIALRAKRKQIGKFGIGKLATYTISNELTYLTRVDDVILSVTIEFTNFDPSPTGGGKEIKLPVFQVVDWKALEANEVFRTICKTADIDLEGLFHDEAKSWTIAVLEGLKAKAHKITSASLTWVLSTAMPLATDFRLYLNGVEIKSSKETYERVVEFRLKDMPQERLTSIQKSSGEEWRYDGDGLASDSFPSGVSGTVIVTEKSIYAGKSSDLGRSHGFFVRVFGRLINEQDPLFGLIPPSYETFNRFHADIEADDLDQSITAPREGVEDSLVKENFKALLSQIFNEARTRYQAYLETQSDENKRKKEDERNFVNPRLVEHPVGDALTIGGLDPGGAEADETWFYLETETGDDLNQLIRKLYDVTEPRSKYTYKYSKQGRSDRLVRFNPATATFSINEDHEFVRAYIDDGRARTLLEDVVTAEALLEVYLREQHVPVHVIGDVLERRDSLMRSLALDHPYSLELISQGLRDAASDQYDLEIALVAAARALGFVAKHMAKSGEPDGVARLTEYPGGQKKIILEAKSSAGTPSLSALDFAGLHEHMTDKGGNRMDGCLLVSPSYPGQIRQEGSAVAARAKELKISCWTVDQLARVVQAAEVRHITAEDVLNIVLTSFSPDQVTKAVERIFEQPTWDKSQLYNAIVEALQELEGRLEDKPRTFDMIATVVSSRAEFSGIQVLDIEQAVKELAAASHGGLFIRSGSITLRTSIAEIERRLRGLTGQSGEPRRESQFRNEG